MSPNERLSSSLPVGSQFSTAMGRIRSQESLSASPLVRASLARDIEEDSDDNEGDQDDDHDAAVLLDSDSADSENGGPIPGYDASAEHAVDLANSYRRASFSVAGPRAAVVLGLHTEDRLPTAKERHQAWREERSLLRDNNIIPPKHPQHTHSSDHPAKDVIEGFGSRLAKQASRIGLGVPGGDRKVVPTDATQNGAGRRINMGPSSEETPLLTPISGDPELPYGGLNTAEDMNKRWEEAVAAGKIQTTWQREAKTIGRYTAPLVLTLLLQYSLTVASIFAVGRLGTVELGAVCLASMSANITGYVIYQGLATSLDTLCAQAYGFGKKKLVGLQMQRMVYFLWVCTIPIAAIWLASPQLLKLIVPEQRTAELAGLYLRVALIGCPGFAAFESGKRYLQAQGLFSASLYVLLICAPLNAFMNYLFVWHFGWGFIGAPIAVAIIDNILPLLLIAYVRFVDGRQCWPGLTKRALHNWGPMIKLALPGLVMVEAECLAFEVLTLASSYFGTTALAAQSILATASNITWQLPFPLSIATSTRIANLIGATLPDAAKVTGKVGGALAVCVGLFNFAVLAGLRNFIPRLFSNDEAVIEMVARVLPLCAAFQLFDALAANANGILRGMGRQVVGGYVQLFCYYVVAMPISMGTAFGAGFGLAGLWLGVAVALALVFIIETIFVSRTSWEDCVAEAQGRLEVA